MYLDPWMLVLAVFMYGVCAYVSRKSGVLSGAYQTLQLLEKNKVIKISQTGDIKPYDEKNKIAGK